MTIKPALSSEEWSHLAEPYEGTPAWEHMAEDAVTFLEVFLGTSPPKDAAAAALLYGQPAGFTWADVDALRLLIDKAAYLTDEGPYDAGWKSPELKAAIQVAESIADKIAALLPPRENTGPGNP